MTTPEPNDAKKREEETESQEDVMKRLKKEEEADELDAIRISEATRPQGPGPGL